MKNKIILSILIIIILITVTGCKKGVKTQDTKTGKNRTEYTCIKKGIEKNSSTTDSTYTLDVTNQARLDDDGKLTYYSTKSHYTLKSKDECNKSCDTATKWNDEINEKKYSGSHRVTTCKCDNNEYTEEYIYDDITSLDSFVRSDISELKDDNSFDLDSWINKYEKIGYNCN